MEHKDRFKSGGYSKKYSDNYNKIDWGKSITKDEKKEKEDE
jgi:hypothetical protein